MSLYSAQRKVMPASATFALGGFFLRFPDWAASHVGELLHTAILYLTNGIGLAMPEHPAQLLHRLFRHLVTGKPNKECSDDRFFSCPHLPGQ
jgi:hypothetical protein